jgi:hypothetical protein
MSSKPDWMKESDELAEGDAVGEQAESGSAAINREAQDKPTSVAAPVRPERASPSASIIRTPEDVPEALERIDRMKIDREWLLRRAGKKR